MKCYICSKINTFNILTAINISKLHNHMDVNKEYSTKRHDFRYLTYVILLLYFCFWLPQDTSEIMKQFGILLIFVATAMSVESVHPQYHSKCKQIFFNLIVFVNILDPIQDQACTYWQV